MGREIRRVPPNWEHPKNENGRYQAITDRNYLDELNEWWENHQLWLKGEHPHQNDDEPSTEKFYAETEGNPPEIEYYRTYSDEEATWYQLYETVSEGTPLSPPFETKEELAKYLAENGDFWGGRPTLEQARKLVDAGWAMSFMAQRTESGVKMYDAYEQQDVKGA